MNKYRSHHRLLPEGVLSLMRGMIPFLALIAFAAPASAGPSHTGAWRANGYRIEADGNRYNCEVGACLRASPKVCAGTNVLRPYTEARLALIARMLKFQFHHCKESVTNGDRTQDRKLQCDEGLLTQHLDQPDDAHISYFSNMDSPRLGTMTVGTQFEWIDAGCDGVTQVIRPVEGGPRP